jgi:hypothetical protein
MDDKLKRPYIYSHYIQYNLRHYAVGAGNVQLLDTLDFEGNETGKPYFEFPTTLFIRFLRHIYISPPPPRGTTVPIGPGPPRCRGCMIKR